jgi:hypothetical protein
VLIGVIAQTILVDPDTITIVSVTDITFPVGPSGRRLLDTPSILTELLIALDSQAKRTEASSRYQNALDAMVALFKAEVAAKLPQAQQPQEPIIPSGVLTSSPPPSPGTCKLDEYQYFVNNCASNNPDPTCQIFVGQFPLTVHNFKRDLTALYNDQPVENRFILICAGSTLSIDDEIDTATTGTTTIRCDGVLPAPPGMYPAEEKACVLSGVRFTVPGTTPPARSVVTMIGMSLRVRLCVLSASACPSVCMH